MAIRADERPGGPHELVRLSGVCVAYAEGAGYHMALEDVSLTIEEGTFTAVVGPNASGKSTLTGVLAGRVPVSRGDVRRISGLRTGIVTQQAGGVPLADSVWEDVCAAIEPLCLPRAELEQRADQALHEAGLAAFGQRDPLSLSGGERRLLALAASLAGKPDLLVFDEVTAMLDGREQKRVLEIVHRIGEQGAAIVWVTQRLEELAHADRVLALQRGQLAFDGGPRDFFYGDPASLGQAGVCASLGLSEPYAVETARRILAAGLRMTDLPLTVEELADACAGFV